MKSASAVRTHHAPTTASATRQAFLLLRTVFTVAPILFGLDKFTNILTDWTVYLAPAGHRPWCPWPPRPSCTSWA